LEKSWSASTRLREDFEVGKSNFISCDFIKNLLEGGIIGSFSMKKEASS